MRGHVQSVAIGVQKRALVGTAQAEQSERSLARGSPDGLPGLQAFISTLELESPEVKREQDAGRNEVRIMTVHASKGLEAPVVFLVDSGSKAFTKP